MKNKGSNIMRFPELMKPDDLKVYDLGALFESNTQLDFRCIVSSLAPKSRDMGVFNNKHFYICTRGIYMYANCAYGYIHHAKITLRSKQAFPENSEEYSLYFCPWNYIRIPRTKRIVFFNRRSIVSEKKSIERLKRDLAKSKRIHENPLYSYLTKDDEVKNRNGKDGIYAGDDGIVYIMKANSSHHYFYDKWLTFKDFKYLISKSI